LNYAYTLAMLAEMGLIVLSFIEASLDFLGVSKETEATTVYEATQ
jgi:hypothetical protein